MSCSTQILRDAATNAPIRNEYGQIMLVGGGEVPTSREAALRLEAAAAITSTINTQLGIVDMAEGQDNFFESLIDTPQAIVLPARNGSWNGQTRHFDIVIPVRMYFGALSDVNEDFTCIEDIWVAARDLLRDEDSWTRSPPDEMTITGPECRTDLKPVMVFMYDFELTFPG